MIDLNKTDFVRDDFLTSEEETAVVINLMNTAVRFFENKDFNLESPDSALNLAMEFYVKSSALINMDENEKGILK